VEPTKPLQLPESVGPMPSMPEADMETFIYMEVRDHRWPLNREGKSKAS
jgi:hypothetical protein